MGQFQTHMLLNKDQSFLSSIQHLNHHPYTHQYCCKRIESLCIPLTFLPFSHSITRSPLPLLAIQVPWKQISNAVSRAELCLCSTNSSKHYRAQRIIFIPISTIETSKYVIFAIAIDTVMHVASFSPAPTAQACLIPTHQSPIHPPRPAHISKLGVCPSTLPITIPAAYFGITSSSCNISNSSVASLPI